MQYHFDEIGKRIKKNRKGLKDPREKTHYGKQKAYSQERFAEDFHMSKSTVVAIEKGNEKQIATNLFTMCRAFKCDAGYLLGEYECSNYENQKISDITGLSDASINKLKQKDADTIAFLNILLEESLILPLMLDLVYYQMHTENLNPKNYKHHVMIDNQANNSGSSIINEMMNNPRVKGFLELKAKVVKKEEGFIALTKDVTKVNSLFKDPDFKKFVYGLLEDADNKGEF